MRSLSALLSQVLVAYTVEFDNEFELLMSQAGYRGARLSLFIWRNLMRFIGSDGTSVRDLATQSLTPADQVKFELGCLERWGFIFLQPGKRAGWGSGRGIRVDWIVNLALKGKTSVSIWPPLFSEIEHRWERRFGSDQISRLRKSLCIDPTHSDSATLAELLSQLLEKFQLEFDRESPLPLVYCANTIRVLGDEPIRLAEIPRLTGSSPETSDIGWQLKPYVVVTADPAARRGKVVRLSPRGMKAQETYHRLIGEIEKRWEERFGKAAIHALRESLEGLLASASFSKGLVAPKGTVRAGDQAPALGRRDVGPAARQRMRDLVAQTEAFVSDPARSLPHYPAWDMNRGFGP